MNTGNRIDAERAKSLMQAKLLKRMPEAGEYDSGLEGLRLYRRDEATEPESCFYKPLVIMLAQGSKRTLLGGEEYIYGEDVLLITGVDIPGMSVIAEASAEKPCLTMALELNPSLLAQLALEMPPTGPVNNRPVRGILMQPIDTEMRDAFLRLEELIDNQQQISFLAPLVIREIHYRLLTGPNGNRLRSFYTQGTHNNQVTRAIEWLRKNYRQSVQVEELADIVHMSPSTFHRRFKDVTALSPVQYQKKLRLHEAQRLMLVEKLDANNASEAVGYESVTQFNREYKRLFGEPPRRDITRLKQDSTPSGRESAQFM